MTGPRGLLISILNWNGLEENAGLPGCIGARPARRHACRRAGQRLVRPTPPPISRHAFPALNCTAKPVKPRLHAATTRSCGGRSNAGSKACCLPNNDCRITIEAIEAMQAMLASEARIAAVSPLIYTDTKSAGRRW